MALLGTTKETALLRFARVVGGRQEDDAAPSKRNTEHDPTHPSGFGGRYVMRGGRIVAAGSDALTKIGLSSMLQRFDEAPSTRCQSPSRLSGKQPVAIAFS